MIRHIRGTVAALESTGIVVDVQGVGYFVYTTSAPEQFKLKEPVTFFTHHAIRETAQDLYGFSSPDELEIFELLLTIPKVGPKTALQFLVQADVALIKTSVINEDATSLSKLSGITKKSAEKIVLGLKDKFETLGYTDAAIVSDASDSASPFVTDTIDALVALGYPQSDARKALQDVQKNHPGISTSAKAVRQALQNLNKT